jgi:thioredoxin-related protein
MKKIMLVFCILLIASNSYAKEPQWKKFNVGIAEAKNSGKKILIDVYTDWCKWCKTMDTVTYVDAKIKDYLNKNYVLIKLNGESQEKITYAGQTITANEFAQGMGVTSFPATLFLKSDGQAITMLPGYVEPERFIYILSFISEDHYEKKKFADYLIEKGVKD